MNQALSKGRGPEPGELPLWLLTAAALLAAAFHQLLCLLPLALLLFLPALLFGNSFLLAMAGLGFVILAWVMQARRAALGRPLTRDEAPALFASVEALCQRMGAARIHHIVLSSDLNAGAVELNRGVSLRPTRRVLVLGLPLLRLLDPPAVEAVIAHELGHFSRRHGRLGHWLYRTRQAWLDWSETVEADESDSSAWERGGHAFAQLFLPWFARVSDAHSRRCEFEADALAASQVPASDLGRALLILALAEQRDATRLPGHLATLQRRSATAPMDWADWPACWVGDQAPDAEELRALLAQHQARGSHPPHAQRLAALGLRGDELKITAAAAGGSAAELWLGERYQALGAELSPWATLAARQSWAMAHAVLSRLEGELEDDESPGAVPPRAAELERWSQALENGQAQAYPLSPSRQAALAAALDCQPAVAQAWLLNLGSQDRCQPALVLRLDPEQLSAQQLDEGQIATQVQGVAELLWPLPRTCLLRQSYTTEGVPPALGKVLQVLTPLKGEPGIASR